MTETETVARDALLAEALRHRDLGFDVFSVWGVKPDGTCRCKDGPACDQQGKHPIPPNGFHAASADPERIRTMLSVASHPNYGIVWPTDRETVFEWDWDGADWRERVRQLTTRLGPLPPTKTTTTPSTGRHVFYRWPAIVEPPPGLGHMFGFVTRWPGQGYVVGPGSHDHRGAWVDTSKVDDIATLPKEWALAAVAEARPALRVVASSSDALITMRPGGDYEVPERVRASESRYEAIRSYVAHLYNFGLTEDEMWSLVVSKLAPVFDEPLDEARLRSRFRRAVRGMAERLGPPASAASTVSREVPAETVAAAGDIWVSASEYMAKHADKPHYCSPLAVFGGVSLISGPPKAGKSTLMMGMLWQRTDGGVFLWGEPVPAGPTLYVTEEAGVSVAMKLDPGLALDVIDMPTFRTAGLSSRAHLLALITRWCESKASDHPALVLVDTFAMWAGIRDENDSVEATAAMADLKELAARLGAAIAVVAHTRKGGGESGEAIRGSSAIFGTADLSIEFRYKTTQASDLRALHISGRFGSPSQHILDFDRIEGTYSVAEPETESDPDRLSELPTRGSGEAGFTSNELAVLWDISRAAATNKANVLVAKGRLAKESVSEPGSRVTRNLYWRVELLTVGPAGGAGGSVGSEMSDIFGGGD